MLSKVVHGIFIKATERKTEYPSLLAIPSSLSEVSVKTIGFYPTANPSSSPALGFPDRCNLCGVRYDCASSAICTGVGKEVGAQPSSTPHTALAMG